MKYTTGNMRPAIIISRPAKRFADCRRLIFCASLICMAGIRNIRSQATSGRARASLLNTNTIAIRPSKIALTVPERNALVSLPLHRSHERPFILSEALCFFVMVSGGETLGIVRDFAAVGFICLDGGKAKQSDRDIDRALYADAGKTEGRRGWAVARHEIAMMRASIFLYESHPHPRVMLKLHQLVRIDRVA